MLLGNPYFYITLFGLAMKIWATQRLFKTRSNTQIPLLFFSLLLIACFTQTLCEIAIYSMVGQTDKKTIHTVMYAYYLATFGILSLLPLAMAELLYKRINRYIILLASSLFLTLSYLIICTDFLLIGIRQLSYSFTRIPGEYYYIFQVYVILVLLICLVMLGGNVRLASGLKQIKASNLLISFIPFAFIVTIVMVCMCTGIDINMVGPVPLLISIFIITISKNLTDNVFDYRIYLPWTKQAKLIRTITAPFRELNYTMEAYKNNHKVYEQMLIKQALVMFSTRKEAAKWLGISESKISRTLAPLKE